LVYYGGAGGSGGAGAAQAGAAALPGTGEGVDLNFENTPVTAVAKVILGDILGLGYTIDPRVQGTISLASGRPVPKTKLLFVLESALRASNAVLAHDAGGYRILPADDAIGSGGVDRAGGRQEPGYGVTVIPLRHVSAPTMMKLLEGFAAKAGAIRADPGNNLLVVIGNGIERRTAVDTVLSFDADWMRGQSVGIFPVVNATPEPLIAELEKILDSGEGGLSQALVKLQPIGHLNAILVVARKPEMLRTAGTWISRLDGSDSMGPSVKVYRVRYGDARQIAKLLSNLFGGGGGFDQGADQLAPGSGATTLSASASNGTQAQGQTGSSPFGALSSASGQSGNSGGFGSSSSGGSGFGSSAGTGAGGSLGSRASLTGAGAGFGAGGGGVGGSGSSVLPGVKITADVTNNAVVVYANPAHYRIIEKALQQIDRPRLQVAVDLTIAEVTLTDQLSYGVQFFLGSLNTLHSFSNGVQAINSATNSLPTTDLPGFNLMLGSKLTPHVIINALHDYTTVKILSNPSLVVVDNQVATLTVGDQIPIQVQQSQSTVALAPVINSIDYRNTGIILRIRPQINANGSVLLDIEQEISQCQNCRTAVPNLTPTIAERKVKSSLLVTTGQTVLLAGLVSDNQDGGRSGIPVLDQIPLIGEAFVNSAGKSYRRTELIIFVRPQIIRNGVDASFVAEELRSKMRGDKIGSYRPPGAVIPNPPPMLVQ
jgi:general secretion pathway protein D